MKIIKQKKCRKCKNLFTPKTSLQIVCGIVCAIARSNELTITKKTKDWNKEKRAIREQLKTISDYEKEARKYFQMWIRKRDENLPCISCPATESIQWDAGHFYKAEIFSGLIFDEKNVHKQCVRCNRYLHGNDLEYREGIIKRYGDEYFKSLESTKDSKRNHKYTILELKQIKKKYYDLCKHR